jgi:hypothetical protein
MNTNQNSRLVKHLVCRAVWVHFRYELGFVPAVIDGKRHKLKVVLAKEAKEEYRGVRLTFQGEYIPAAVLDWAR